MKANDRTEAEYARDFAIGKQTEQNFIDTIGAMGGSAGKIDHLPKLGYPQPRISCPSSDGSVTFIVAPDAFLRFPNGPTILAEVKRKNVEGKLADGSAFFYLDEEQIHRMRRTARYFPHVIFAVECPQLKDIEGYEFVWIDIHELDHDRIELLKRSKTFLIPFSLFKPITQLKEYQHDLAQSFP